MPRSRASKRNQTKPRPKSQPTAAQPIAPSVKADIEPPEPQQSAAKPTKQIKVAAPRPFSTWLQTWLPIVLSGLVLIVVVAQAYIDQKQWEVMERAIQVENRAYVGVRSVGLRKPLKAGESVHGAISFINKGNTPAVKVVGRVSFGFGVPIREPMEPLPGSVETQASTSVMQKDGELSEDFISDIPIEEEIVTKVREGKTGFYVWGRVDYFDFFEKPHITRFCFKLNPENGTDFQVCHVNNTAN